ncbi:hypothetical protein SAM23877_7434 [Streptomyces ambofaciens ATCC 23877]|uniref:Uncharacterized protein SAMR0203 n=1 Tax=Streptomyces ambofaciens (strain ATCC 23877 / 3486 / DSM 40053 / JCM 4204 / NBRC 12836 / NRRL B-2516) TaxID=278992 RepID=Q1RQN3_STRA7|nr:hypothetical protein SAM23877_7434 [Streptomyces ambofaciens ATCC 23877]CAI78406.1 conserved hypothetical protein [Streptomyces ambofaciens ATCC 23877]CAJ87911.1 conserved hypothetical protein [Streptomyces ambofaciens ATCC 23877]
MRHPYPGRDGIRGCWSASWPGQPARRERARALGPGAVSPFTLLVAPRDGELALAHGNPDAAHSSSDTGDVAAALVAVSSDERAWGRVWHAPVITTTARHAATDLAGLHGAPEPRLEQLTERDMTLLPFTDSTVAGVRRDELHVRASIHRGRRRYPRHLRTQAFNAPGSAGGLMRRWASRDPDPPTRGHEV